MHDIYKHVENAKRYVLKSKLWYKITFAWFENWNYSVKFNEKMIQASPVFSEYWFGLSYKILEYFHFLIPFADAVFFKVLTQISIEFCGHQSWNWFNNFVIIPPIPNDLD